ncbi:WcaI family glycosyltransferase [Erythrobacter sp. SDW2]|uniref:WcaI family glycosyltransferase n=1 Tax=Erythrobacter sp. SDW2 TaxID=2907154 RepID=UPI001F25FBF2|nr:WcaI family glycosyltransferase [Erythrobacter sp. SDW2]UIP07174.1 WcaI family glycosyltransferase [Erythrobacter sp. SDW2]
MASICLVGLNYAPEPIGIGPYTQGWAEALAARGHRVQVVCGVPYYPQWQRFDGFGDGFRLSVENGVRVLRVPHYVPADPGGLKRLVHYASFSVNAARGIAKAVSDVRPDAVIAVAPALLASPVATRLARRCGALSWLHVQDFEVEAALATGLLPGWATGFGTRFERSMLRRFDRVSSIAPGMMRKLAEKRGHDRGLHELRNWAEPSVGTGAANGARMRQSLGLPPGTIALYSGNLARKQGIGIILDTARAMADMTDLHFVICGEGPAVAEVRDTAAGVANLHYRPLQPREALPDLLDMADIHLLPQIAGAADLVLPSKLANMLASGRPVVATADAGTSLAAEVAGCGIVVPAGDSAGLAASIAVLAGDAARRTALGRAARARALEHWSKDALLAQCTAAIEQALAERCA